MIVRLLAASFTLLAASCSTIISVTREEEGGWQVVDGQAASWVVVANMTDLREEEGWLHLDLTTIKPAGTGLNPTHRDWPRV